MTKFRLPCLHYLYEEDNIGTVPVNKKHMTGSVPMNKEHITGIVPVNKENLTGTLFKFWGMG